MFAAKKQHDEEHENAHSAHKVSISNPGKIFTTMKLFLMKKTYPHVFSFFHELQKNTRL